MDKKLKEGVSVQELENFGRKYLCEIFLVLYFLLATLFTFIFFGVAWSIFLTGIGAILGVFFPNKIHKLRALFSHFMNKQEKVTRLILGGVGVILSLFLPPLVFFCIGLFGGFSMHKLSIGIEGKKLNKGDLASPEKDSVSSEEKKTL